MSGCGRAGPPFFVAWAVGQGRAAAARLRLHLSQFPSGSSAALRLALVRAADLGFLVFARGPGPAHSLQWQLPAPSAAGLARARPSRPPASRAASLKATALPRIHLGDRRPRQRPDLTVAALLVAIPRQLASVPPCLWPGPGGSGPDRSSVLVGPRVRQSVENAACVLSDQLALLGQSAAASSSMRQPGVPQEDVRVSGEA